MSPMRGQALLLCEFALQRGLLPPDRHDEIRAIIESFPPETTSPEALVEHGALTRDELEAVMDQFRMVTRNATPPWAGRGGEEPETPASTGRPAATDGGPLRLPCDFGEDFELREVLGEGGMGVVYRAWQRSLQRFVAVKVLRPGGPASEEWLRRFQTEAHAAARLRHANVVSVHQVGVHAGMHFLSMDLVEGRPLSEVIRHGGLAFRDGLELLRKVARAVDHAHQQGVVHRDLKPSNILVDARGEPLVTDFGLAKDLETDYTLSVSSSVIGTPSYMSPEQAVGRSRDVDARSDVYSLGVILYEMLVGRPPFQAGSLAELLRTIVEDDPAPPCRLNRAVPTDAETICLKALAKEPDRRYQTAEALAGDLRRCLNHEPIAARRSSIIYRTRKTLMRHRGIAVVAALAALLAIGLTVGWVASLKVETRRADEARTAAERAAARADGEADLAKQEAERADQEREATLRERYFLSIQLAERHITDGNHALALQLLDTCPAELRHWEWGRLRRLAGVLVMTITGHARPVYAVAFSPDGHRVASGSDDGTVKLWDRATGREILTMQGHEEGVFTIAFAPGGERIASGSGDGSVRLWDARAGTELLTLKGKREKGFIHSIAFSPNGGSIASVAYDRTVRLWDTATGRETLIPTGDERWIGCSVAFSPDGGRIAVACSDGGIRLWDVRTNTAITTLHGHRGAVYSVAYSPKGDQIASAGHDQTIRLWSTEADREPVTLTGHTGAVRSVAFAPDGCRIVSGAGDQTVKLWDVRSGREILTLRGHQGAVQSVAFSPDGKCIASGGDKTVRLWDADAEHLAVSPDRFRGTHLLAFTPDARSVASVSLDRESIRSGVRRYIVTVWDTQTGHERLTLDECESKVQCLAFSGDGGLVASGGDDHLVRVWDAQSGRRLLSFAGHGDPVRCVALSPDGKRGVSGDERGVLKVWDTETNREAQTLKKDAELVVSVSFSPDGARIVSAGWDRTVRLWDAQTGDEVMTLMGHEGKVGSVAFSADGTRIASASEDGTVRLWDSDTGRELVLLKGHERAIYSVAFSPDGKRVVSGGDDRSVRLWDTESGREVLTLRGQDDPVWLVAFSSDGQWIAVGSKDGSVKVWEAAPYRAERQRESAPRTTDTQPTILDGYKDDRPAVAEPELRPLRVVVDASKGGGGWWSPQAGPDFDPRRPHQGSRLAAYLRRRS